MFSLRLFFPKSKNPPDVSSKVHINVMRKSESGGSRMLITLSGMQFEENGIGPVEDE